MNEIVATNIIASRPPEQPTVVTPTTCAKNYWECPKTNCSTFPHPVDYFDTRLELELGGFTSNEQVLLVLISLYLVCYLSFHIILNF